MDVLLNRKWNIGKLLTTPICVVPLIFAPCSYVYAQSVVANGGDRTIGIEGEALTLSDSENDIYILQSLKGAHLTVNGTINLSSSGERGGGVKADNSEFTAQDLFINVSGLNGTGIDLEGNSNAKINNLEITGSGSAKGLVLNGGVGADQRATANVGQGIIKTDTGSAITVAAGELILTKVSASTLGANNHALEANAGATVTVGEGGTFATEGGGSSAVSLSAADAIVTMNNVTITTEGKDSNGVDATKGKAILNGSSITTNGINAAGLNASQGGEGEVNNSTIKTNGELSSALVSSSGSKITADTVNIQTTGKQGYGALARESTLDMRNSDISTSGEKASGIYVAGLGTSQISLEKVNIDTKLAQAIEVNAASAVMNVNNSVLNSGTGQALTVNHFVDSLDPGSNLYSDVTFNAQGSTLNGDITSSVIDNTVAVNLSTGSILNGNVTRATSLDLSGSTLNGTVKETKSLALDASSTWNMNNSSDVGQLTNNGTINFSDTINKTKFDTLTVAGDYAGDGGLLKMYSALGDDSSETDKLIVAGDVLLGTTRVAVENLGGQGAQTVEGIEIVEVGGTSIGGFAKSGRIVAGGYDYDLVKKDESWYLTSQQVPVEPDPTPAPDTGTDTGTDPDTGTGPGADNGRPLPPPARQPSIIRPEAGSYTANLAAANTMFLLTLHDRVGETQFIDALTGQKEVTSMWLRQLGGHNKWRDGSGQLKTQSNRYVAQIGGDVARWSTDGLDRWHVGFMAGYGNNHSTTKNQISGYRSKASVDGYSVGGYATWYANDEDHTGAHLDSWLQYSWFNNEVSGDKLATETYKSHGISASLEGGYTWKLAQFAGSQGSLNEWFIQPQAQVVWMGVRADNVQEANGTRVTGKGDGNVQTRLGVKTYLKGHHAIDKDKQREFQPFLQVNWLHNTRNFGTQMDDVRVNQSGATNLAEVKVGLEGKVNPRLNLWGNVGVQMGDEGYNDSAAMVGVKYNF